MNTVRCLESVYYSRFHVLVITVCLLFILGSEYPLPLHAQIPPISDLAPLAKPSSFVLDGTHPIVETASISIHDDLCVCLEFSPNSPGQDGSTQEPDRHRITLLSKSSSEARTVDAYKRASSPEFISRPRISPDGLKIAWITIPDLRGTEGLSGSELNKRIAEHEKTKGSDLAIVNATNNVKEMHHFNISFHNLVWGKGQCLFAVGTDHRNDQVPVGPVIYRVDLSTQPPSLEITYQSPTPLNDIFLLDDNTGNVYFARTRPRPISPDQGHIEVPGLHLVEQWDLLKIEQGSAPVSVNLLSKFSLHEPIGSVQAIPYCVSPDGKTVACQFLSEQLSDSSAPRLAFFDIGTSQISVCPQKNISPIQWSNTTSTLYALIPSGREYWIDMKRRFLVSFSIDELLSIPPERIVK